jgi:hypothetical protein
MSLPLLGNDFLSSPNARGAITGKTADILAESGARLADRIEMQSTAAEAKALAPGISDLYSSAYQKIAAGDFTGFADMQKARSMATGNPILMKTMDDADHLAGTLAGEYTRTQLAKMQIEKSASIDADRDARLNIRMKQDAADKSLLAARSYHATETSAWERENADVQRSYEKELSIAQNRQNSENTMARLEGRQPNQIPMPEKPQMRPRPNIDDAMQKFGVQSAGAPLPSQGLDLSQNPVGDASSVPFQPTSSAVPNSEPVGQAPSMTAPQAKAAAGAEPINAPLPSGPGEASQTIDLMSQDTPDAQQPAAATAPLVNQKTPNAGEEVPHGTPVLNFGTLRLTVPKNKLEMKGVTTDERTGDIKPSYEFTKDDKKFTEAAAAIHPAAQSFISDAMRSGERANFEPASTEDKIAAGHDPKEKDLYILKASDGTIAHEQNMDLNGMVKRDEKTGKALPDKPRVFGKDQFEAWQVMQGSKGSHGLQIDFPKLEDPAQKDGLRNAVLADMASNPDKLKKLGAANNMLKSWGVEPIASEDIQQHLAAAQDKAKADKEAKVKASQDAHLNSQLQDRGIIDKPTNAAPAAGPRANWDVHEYEQRIAANEERLKTIAQFKSDGRLTDEHIKEAKMLQDEINTYKGELQSLHIHRAAGMSLTSPMFSGFF